ncbi:hypothetical protein FA13DRAFT_841432 [Coprinellus micaceus]|uniref:Uncharacterized protein n=1 Tax=Coprinellus micaceus TaxID=71717 RepID=A0A4Y7T152_COPMI|nr:hypothetical protein FA13DRAFT_841432 [Coprinellus micaceus]
MTASAITTLNPTPSPSPKPKVSSSTVSHPAIPSVENVPNTPVPPHIKQMRFLLVFTLFFSAYAIYASILLTKLTFNFIPTVALATWTLVMLFPLELDHHEGVAESERHLLKWIVDQRIVLNSQRTAGAWGRRARGACMSWRAGGLRRTGSIRRIRSWRRRSWRRRRRGRRRRPLRLRREMPTDNAIESPMRYTPPPSLLLYESKHTQKCCIIGLDLSVPPVVTVFTCCYANPRVILVSHIRAPLRSTTAQTISETTRRWDVLGGAPAVGSGNQAQGSVANVLPRK